MKVSYKGNTVNISYSYSEDNEHAFDVYVWHEVKEVAQDALYALVDALPDSCNTIDEDDIGDGWNISTAWFYDVEADEEEVYEWKHEWTTQYQQAIKTLREEV